MSLQNDCDAALRRAQERTAAFDIDNGLNALLRILSARRYRRTESGVEAVAEKLIELSIRFVRLRALRDGLHYYRITAQLSQHAGGLAKIVTQAANLVEEELRKAKGSKTVTNEGIKMLLRDDKVGVDSTTGVAIGDDEEDRELGVLWGTQLARSKLLPRRSDLLDLRLDVISDKRRELTTLLKFAWETFKSILELLRTTPRLEKVYHEIAERAFQYCVDNTRIAEFKRLGEILRSHFAILSRPPTGKFRDGFEGLSHPVLHIPTRLKQIKVGSQLKLWNEVKLGCEDIVSMGLLENLQKYERGNLSEVALPKGALLSWSSAYFNSLIEYTWACENYLFHSFSCLKSLNHTRQHKKELDRGTLRHLSSKAVLSFLCLHGIFYGDPSSRTQCCMDSAMPHQGALDWVGGQYGQEMLEVGIGFNDYFDDDKVEGSLGSKERRNFLRDVENTDPIKAEAFKGLLNEVGQCQRKLRYNNLLNTSNDSNFTAASTELLDLLKVQNIPTYGMLCEMLISRGVVTDSYLSVQKLFYWLICCRTHIGLAYAGIDFLEQIEYADPILAQYTPLIKRTIVTKITIILSKLYSTASVDYLREHLLPEKLLPWAYVEQSIAHVCKDMNRPLHIDSQHGYISFGYAAEEMEDNDEETIGGTHESNGVGPEYNLGTSQFGDHLVRVYTMASGCVKTLCDRYQEGFVLGYATSLRQFQAKNGQTSEHIDGWTNADYGRFVGEYYGSQIDALQQHSLFSDSTMPITTLLSLPKFIFSVLATTNQMLWHSVHLPFYMLADYTQTEVEYAARLITEMRQLLLQRSNESKLKREKKLLEKERAEILRKANEAAARKQEEQVARLELERAARMRTAERLREEQKGKIMKAAEGLLTELNALQKNGLINDRIENDKMITGSVTPLLGLSQTLAKSQALATNSGQPGGVVSGVNPLANTLTNTLATTPSVPQTIGMGTHTMLPAPGKTVDITEVKTKDPEDTDVFVPFVAYSPPAVMSTSSITIGDKPLSEITPQHIFDDTVTIRQVEIACDQYVEMEKQEWTKNRKLECRQLDCLAQALRDLRCANLREKSFIQNKSRPLDSFAIESAKDAKPRFLAARTKWDEVDQAA